MLLTLVMSMYFPKHWLCNIIKLIMTALIGLLSSRLFPFSNFRNVNVYFTTSWTNIRHVCTYLNAFFLVFSNMVMEFHNFDILFTNLVTFLTCCLHSPAAWKALTIRRKSQLDMYTIWVKYVLSFIHQLKMRS